MISSRNIVRLGALAGLLWMAHIPVFSQEKWEKEGEGEIKDVEIEIVKDRKIILPVASRNFGKVPPRPYEPIKPAITYELKTFRFASPGFNPTIRPLKLKQEELSKINGNYVSAGVGNYASFFAEGDISTKRDKNKFLGAHFYTRYFGNGPVSDWSSGSSVVQARIFGKLTGKEATLSGEASFESRGTYFYGGSLYTTSPPPTEPWIIASNNSQLRQVYNTIAVKATVENTQAGDFNYSLTGSFSYLMDHYYATEGLTGLNFKSDYALSKDSRILVGADYYLISRKDSLATPGPRHLLRVKPWYQFSPLSKLMLTVGANIALQNDQYQGSKDFHIYPHARADYDLSDSWRIYGLITGDMDKVDLHTLSAENIWVNRNISILHTNRAFEFAGGLNGKLGNNVSVSAGFSVATLKNYYYFLPNQASLDSFNKFEVVYDGATQRVNPFAEINFTRADRFRLKLRGDYFSYSTDQQQAAWNRPTYRLHINSYYNLYDKITIEAGFIAQGGMKGGYLTGTPPPVMTTVNLDAANDLYLKTRYFVSRQFSVFVQCNNMLSNQYPLFQSYQSRGFQALGGASWSF